MYTNLLIGMDRQGRAIAGKSGLVKRENPHVECRFAPRRRSRDG
jgi:hypothetical protein